MSKIQKRSFESRQALGLPGPLAPKRRLMAKSNRFSKPGAKTTRTDRAWMNFATNNTRHDIIDQLNRLWPDALASDVPRSEEFREGYFQGVMDALSLTRSQTRAIIEDPKVDEASDVKVTIKQEVDFEDVGNIPEKSVVSTVKFRSDPSIKLETVHEGIGEISGNGVVPAVSIKLEPANHTEDDITVQAQKGEVLQDESGSVRSGVLSRLGQWLWYT